MEIVSTLGSRNIERLFNPQIHMERPIQHDELWMPLTLAQQTRIQMPMLDEETTFTALFVLDDTVPISVSRVPCRIT